MAAGIADRAWPGFHRRLRSAEKPVSVLHAALALVLLQRVSELALAAVNMRRLRRLGAIEIDRAGYPLFVALHAGWLASLALLVSPAVPPSWTLLGLFGVLQLGRVWVIASLGR